MTTAGSLGFARFKHALGNQKRVLAANILREIHESTGRGSHKLVLAISEPIIALSVAVIWHTLLSIQPPYGDSRTLFVATGLFPTYVFVHVSSHFRSFAKGVSDERRYPLEQTLDAVIATCLVRMSVYAMAGLLGFSLVYFLVDPMALPHRLSTVLIAFFAMCLLGLGMGLCNASIEQLFPIWRNIWSPIARGLILFSGVIYVPDFLRPDVRNFLSWNPVMQGVELLRQGFYPGYPNICFSASYLVTLIVSLIMGGLILERALRRDFRLDFYPRRG